MNEASRRSRSHNVGSPRHTSSRCDPASFAYALIRARCVVGADGRYSLVARKAGAKVVEDCSERVSSVYFATWKGTPALQPDAERAAQIYATGRGTDVLLIPQSQDRVMIATHQRADRVDIRGDAEAFYVGVLRSYPSLRRRIEGARMVTEVLGMKRVANRYLEHGGRGWVLVGDALHHKDPADGQGIYDAMIEAKLLACQLSGFLAGWQTWGQALDSYRSAVVAETRPMFLATMKRLEKELYDEPPELVIRSLVRWLLSDAEYQRRFVMFLGRTISPDDWLSPGLVVRASARGMAGDLRRLLRGEPAFAESTE